MSTEFVLHRLDSGPSLGQLLKDQRLQLGFTIPDIEIRTRIQSHVIESFERDEFGRLPEIYERGFLQRYASLLGLDVDRILAPFERERRIGHLVTSKDNLKSYWPRFALSGRRLIGLAVLSLVLAFALSFHAISASLGQAPQLSSFSIHTGSSSTTLEGTTRSGDRLWVDGVAVSTGASHFSLPLLLRTTPSRLSLAVKNSLGREVIRTLTVPRAATSLAPPTQPVRLDLRIADRAVHLRVQGASGTLFDGIALPGSASTFADRELTLSTTDAGSTYAKLTTPIGLQDLGRLGSPGESQSGLLFLPGTQVN